MPLRLFPALAIYTEVTGVLLMAAPGASRFYFSPNAYAQC